MIKRYSTLLLVLPLLSLMASPSQAQNYSKHSRYRSFGIGLNGMSYMGDVVPQGQSNHFAFGAMRPGVSLSATQRFAPQFSVRAALTYGRVTGDNTTSSAASGNQVYYERSLKFRNDIAEASAVGIFDLLENRGDYMRRLDWVPYVFAGVAVFHHNPKGQVGGGTIPQELSAGDYVALQPLRTEGQTVGYRRTQFAIPFGGGVRYRLAHDLDLSLEIGWRKTYTDKLDDMGGAYPDVNKLTTPAARYFGHDIMVPEGATAESSIAPDAQWRGYGNHNDWYLVTGVTVHYVVPQYINRSKLR